MNELLILDGGMSRELLRLGAELVQPEWSAMALINSPEIVRQVHAEFLEAGADVITTNSYALVPFHIGEERFAKEGAALIDLSGRLAREAADNAGRKVTVAGGLPPIFGSYEPENFKPETVQDYLTVLVENLNPHVDLWLGETLSLIAEGEAVRVAVKETGKPFWISFTLADDQAQVAAQAEGGEAKLRSGETVRDAALWAAGSRAEALLFNCAKPEVMEKAVRTASAIFAEQGVKIRVGVYANAFESDTDETAANEGLHETRADLTTDAYSRFACNWADAGATLIGGCCGIGASHIHTIAGALRGR